eukprot:1157834-Pelagomonas_calceolata.AAC.12
MCGLFAAQAIGFDMDYTLAQYRPETFEALAHQQTCRLIPWHTLASKQKPLVTSALQFVGKMETAQTSFSPLQTCQRAVSNLEIIGCKAALKSSSTTPWFANACQGAWGQQRPPEHVCMQSLCTSPPRNCMYAPRPAGHGTMAGPAIVEKLVTRFGYPEELRSFTFSWDYMMKGLVIDKELRSLTSGWDYMMKARPAFGKGVGIVGVCMVLVLFLADCKCIVQAGVPQDAPASFAPDAVSMRSQGTAHTHTCTCTCTQRNYVAKANGSTSS